MKLAGSLINEKKASLSVCLSASSSINLCETLLRQLKEEDDDIKETEKRKRGERNDLVGDVTTPRFTGVKRLRVSNGNRVADKQTLHFQSIDNFPP